MSCNGMCAIAVEENPCRFSIFSEKKGVILCECDVRSERDTWFEKITNAAVAAAVSKDAIALAQIRLTSNQELPSETFERHCLRGKPADDQELASDRLEGPTGEKSKSLDLEKIEVQVAQTLIGAAES